MDLFIGHLCPQSGQRTTRSFISLEFTAQVYYENDTKLCDMHIVLLNVALGKRKV